MSTKKVKVLVSLLEKEVGKKVTLKEANENIIEIEWAVGSDDRPSWGNPIKDLIKDVLGCVHKLKKVPGISNVKILKQKHWKGKPLSKSWSKPKDSVTFFVTGTATVNLQKIVYDSKANDAWIFDGKNNPKIVVMSADYKTLQFNITKNANLIFKALKVAKQAESNRKKQYDESQLANVDKVLKRIAPKDITMFLYCLGERSGFGGGGEKFQNKGKIQLSNIIKAILTSKDTDDFQSSEYLKGSGEVIDLLSQVFEDAMSDGWKIKFINILKKAVKNKVFVHGWEEGTTGIGTDAKLLISKVKEEEMKTLMNGMSDDNIF